jgi:hypothetical protein
MSTETEYWRDCVPYSSVYPAMSGSAFGFQAMVTDAASTRAAASIRRQVAERRNLRIEVATMRGGGAMDVPRRRCGHFRENRPNTGKYASNRQRAIRQLITILFR